MAASNRQMNWTATNFTGEAGGSPLTFSGVQSVKLDAGGSVAKFAGDGDRYNSTIVNDFNEPTITVETGDVAAVNSLSIGSVGTFTTTWNDAKNGNGAGSITYTFSCIVSDISSSGKHRAYGMATVTFEAYSSDGVTNPLSFSITA